MLISMAEFFAAYMCVEILCASLEGLAQIDVE
jgi:hypothetical protein